MVYIRMEPNAIIIPVIINIVFYTCSYIFVKLNNFILSVMFR